MVFATLKEAWLYLLFLKSFTSSPFSQIYSIRGCSFLVLDLCVFILVFCSASYLPLYCPFFKGSPASKFPQFSSLYFLFRRMVPFITCLPLYCFPFYVHFSQFLFPLASSLSQFSLLHTSYSFEERLLFFVVSLFLGHCIPASSRYSRFLVSRASSSFLSLDFLDFLLCILCFNSEVQTEAPFITSLFRSSSFASFLDFSSFSCFHDHSSSRFFHSFPFEFPRFSFLYSKRRFSPFIIFLSSSRLFSIFIYFFHN